MTTDQPMIVKTGGQRLKICWFHLTSDQMIRRWLCMMMLLSGVAGVDLGWWLVSVLAQVGKVKGWWRRAEYNG